VSERTSAGLFSRLEWGDDELLIQSEIVHSAEPRITTLLLSDGEVIARAQGEWRATSADQVANQQRMGGYHDRLLRALRRLRSERQIPARELTVIFQKMVDVALRLIASPAAEAFSALPGARWALLQSPDGELVDISPERAPGSAWKDSASRFLYLSERIAGLFGDSQVRDISLRIPSGYILIAPQWGGTLVAEIEPDDLADARKKLRSLVKEKAE